MFRIDRDHLVDGIQRSRFGCHGIDAIAEHGYVDFATDGLGAADAFGRADVQRGAVVFGNDQYFAHNNPLFFSSCTS